MKRFVILLLIISFIGIAIGGSASFGMNPDHNGVCTAVYGTVCPVNIADFAAHHISALQMITMSVAPQASYWLLLLASLLASVLVFTFYKILPYPELEFPLRRLRELSFGSLRGRQKIISWLSLFELSPAL